jgi:hypothetical protein
MDKRTSIYIVPLFLPYTFISAGLAKLELSENKVSVKLGKAAGLDGVHPEFIKNSRRKTGWSWFVFSTTF